MSRKFIFILLAGTATFMLVLTGWHLVQTIGLKKYHQHHVSKLDLVFIPGERQDVVVLGSSRAHYGVNVYLLEKLGHFKVLNTAMDGAKIDEMFVILDSYIANHAPPSVVVLLLDPHSLRPEKTKMFNRLFLSMYLNDPRLYGNLASFAPCNAAAWRFLPFTILSEYDDFMRTCSAKGLAGSTALAGDQFAYKGYVELDRQFSHDITPPHTGEMMNQWGKELYLQLIEKCIRHKVKVVVTDGPFMPQYYNSRHLADFYEQVNQLHAGNDHIIFDFGNSNFPDTAYYKDEAHLNWRGAAAYTEKLFKNFLAN